MDAKEEKSWEHNPTLTDSDKSNISSDTQGNSRSRTNANTNSPQNSDPESLSSTSALPQHKIPYFRMVFDQGAITQNVLSYRYPGSGTSEDPYRVEFLPGETDPRNPMTFSPLIKWSITMIVAIATLAVAFVSSAYTGGVGQIIEEFKISDEVAVLGVSLFVLGFTIGPLLWAPLSEMYGRQLLFFGTYAALTAFNGGAAGANSMTTLLVMRFFAGAFGSSPLTNSGGVIADLFPASQRGLAMSVFAAAPFMGPVLGPIAGGFLGETKGWRWVEGLLCIFSGVVWLVMAVTVPETYAPVLLRKRAERLSKITGKIYVSKMEADNGKLSLKEAYKTALSRPWILLFREPIVLIISIYMAILYGTLYLCFAAFPIVYQQGRGWSQGIGGLPFLGIAIGMLIGIAANIPENKRYNKVADEKFGGFAPPEQRLPITMVGCICIPIGLFWFAWTNSPNIHWFPSIAAGVPFGFGMVAIFLSIFNYLIDAYTIFAASVLAANAVLRSLFGAVFPLFTKAMYRNLGIHWASSIPAFLALICVPAPFLFYKYGASIRSKCKFAREADEFLKKMRESEGDNQEEENEERQVEGDPRIAVQDYDADQDVGEKGYDAIPEPEPSKRQEQNLTRAKSSNSIRHSRLSRWESNPFDIDRVNSREAFEGNLLYTGERSRPRSLR